MTTKSDIEQHVAVYGEGPVLAGGHGLQLVGDGAGGARRTAYVKLGDLPLGIAFALLISSMILVKYANNHEDRNQT